MLVTFRVQYIDDTKISEFVTYDRNSIYNLIQMLEKNSLVEAYTVISEGKPVKDIYLAYSFSKQMFPLDKYTTNEFKW